jgi:glycosyltransferase involved in cell wall biosynthesis
MPVHPIYYIYPMNKWVSFHFIAEKHVRELRKYFYVMPVDEEALTVVMPIAQLAAKSLFFLHPFFYPMEVYERQLLAKIGKPQGLIGVDVADSDHITSKAVNLIEYAEAMIVPSNFSRNSYLNSGVKKNVYVLPHGVDEEYISLPSSKPNTFRRLAEYKDKKNKKLIQIWLLHSSYRKGEDLAYEIFNKLIDERKDVALVVRRPMNLDIYDCKIDVGTLKPSFSMTASWLTDEQIRELNDVCDIYLLTSRGGGFEHPPLLALARGEPVVGARGGAWDDYLPDWCLTSSHRSGQILANNPIHDGYGVEIDVDKAVSRLHEILDNLDEYRVRVRQYVNTCVRAKFTWGRIGLQLKSIVEKHLS